MTYPGLSCNWKRGSTRDPAWQEVRVARRLRQGVHREVIGFN